MHRGFLQTVYNEAEWLCTCYNGTVELLLHMGKEEKFNRLRVWKIGDKRYFLCCCNIQISSLQDKQSG